MGQIKSFLKQTLAQLTGDTDKVIAEKNYRKATSAINGQIASLKAKLVDDEQVLEDAQKELADAKYPDVLITDTKSYLSNIRYKSESVDVAKASLDSTKLSIQFNEDLLKEFDTQVDE